MASRTPPTIVIVDADGARGTAAAAAVGDGTRTAVWVGEGDEPALADFRAELDRRA